MPVFCDGMPVRLREQHEILSVLHLALKEGSIDIYDDFECLGSSQRTECQF